MRLVEAHRSNCSFLICNLLEEIKVHCSLLAEEAIHAALWDYAEKHGIVIEGLKKPVNDISEHEEAEEEEY